MINKMIIYEYMMRIGRDDIYNFANSQGIKLDNNEIDIIYGYIKRDYKRILNNPEDVLYEIKGKVNDKTYSKIVEYYNKYKNKIK